MVQRRVSNLSITLAERVEAVTKSVDDHMTNVVAALALALNDRVRVSIEEVTGHSAAAPAALIALHEFLGGGSMDQLRQAIGLSPSGAVRLVDRLVAGGYVQRQSAADARSVALVLTKSGRAVAAKMQAARAAAVGQVLEGLSKDERKCLTEVADKALSAIVELRLNERDRGLPVGGWLCRLCDFAACGRSEAICPAAITAQEHYA
jgi:MarR family transcriptional repressor of emrRAB